MLWQHISAEDSSCNNSTFCNYHAGAAVAHQPEHPLQVSSVMMNKVLQECLLLMRHIDCTQCKHADAVKELDRRQDSYMRREEQLKLQLAALTQTQEAGDSSGGTSSDGSSSSSPHDEPGPDDTSQPAASSSRAPKAPKPLTLQEMQEQVGCERGCCHA